MTISEFLRELKKRNKLLYGVGLVHAILFVIFLLLSFVDAREVAGVNTWIKPMKFALSITIYVWTVAWVIAYLPHPNRARWIAIIVAITMIAEMLTIGFQAGRGVGSHYNVTSAFNGMIFTVMGVFIGLNTLANLALLILFLGPTINLQRSMKIAWQFGLFSVCIGSVSGIVMVIRLAHTVGAPDGGPGLPFVNWSTVGGDIRMAHFFTLHGLQFIPVSWWVISERMNLTHKTWVAVALASTYIAFCLVLHWAALQGIAPIRLS